MTRDPVHIIGQSVIDLVIHSPDYRDVQEEAADLFKSGLSHSVNRLFDEMNAGAESFYLLEHLQIDLGTIERKHFSKEFEKRLLEQLRRSLGKIRNNRVEKAKIAEDVRGLTIRSEKDNHFAWLTHFLLRGFLPWQSTLGNKTSLEQLFADAISEDPAGIRKFLFRQGANESLIKRIVFQFSEKLVYSLIEVLEPREAAFIIAYLERLKEENRRKRFIKKDGQQFEKVRLRVTLSYLLDRGDSHFNRKEFVRNTLHSVARHYNLSYKQVLNWFLAALEEDEELRESRSGLAEIIREIAGREEAPVVADTNVSDTFPVNDASFFGQVVFAEKNSIIVLLRNDNETRYYLNRQNKNFGQALQEYLVDNKGLDMSPVNVIILYEESRLVGNIIWQNKLSTGQLAVIARQYIDKGYVGAGQVFGKRDRARHLFTVWLRHYPEQFKKLLLPMAAKENNGLKSTTEQLYRALLLFFGEKAKEMLVIISEFMVLPRRFPVTAYPSYYRQFIILKTFQYTAQFSNTAAYRKYMMTVVAHEFRLSEDQLEDLLKYNRTSNGAFISRRNTPFSITPVTAILQQMADKTSAGKISVDAQKLTGPSSPSFEVLGLSKGFVIKDGVVQPHSPAARDHLPAIEFYFVFSSLPWWYSHDISTLREQLQVLVTSKDRQLLALLLKHRSNSVFVSNLIQEWVVSGGSHVVHTVIGLQPATLIRFYKKLYSFLKGMAVPDQNIAYRFFETLIDVIHETKSFDIRRTDFLAKLFRPLVNEKTGSRKRVERLLLQLALFTEANTSVAPHSFDKRETFIKLLSLFFREEYDLTDETMSMMLGEQLGNMILNQYSGKLREPFDDTLHILLEMKATQPLHAAWIEGLCTSLGSDLSFGLLVKQLAGLANTRRSAWLLRGLLRKKRVSFLQYSRLAKNEMIDAVSVLLLNDQAGFSFVKDAETVFTAVTSSKPSQAILFWPVVLDYTIKRSAFNQKNLLYSLLTSFAQVGKTSFYQLVADAILFIQSAAYTGNRQPLLQLLFELTDDKKVAQLLNKQEPLIKPVTTNENTRTNKTTPKNPKKQVEEKKYKPLLEEGESVYINNAGLVLINPFIKRLFDMLVYTENNAFKTINEQTRAIHLLQFVAAGFENAGEQYLFFNKILCGVDPLEPLEAITGLTTEEKQAAESLLSNVINNWPAMKNASIDGLRGSYLVRDGRLRATDQGWKLVVEKKPYDILLNQLPWAFTTVKLPWMTKPVFVQWI